MYFFDGIGYLYVEELSAISECSLFNDGDAFGNGYFVDENVVDVNVLSVVKGRGVDVDEVDVAPRLDGVNIDLNQSHTTDKCIGLNDFNAFTDGDVDQIDTTVEGFFADAL